jgi:hypothetical protein
MPFPLCQHSVADEASVAPALAGASNPFQPGAAVDSALPNAYPICGFSHAVLRAHQSTNCPLRHGLLLFLHWALSRGSRNRRIGHSGFAALPTHIMQLSSSLLYDASCAGGQLLKDSYVPQHTGPAWIVALALGSAAFAACCVVFALTFL